MEEYSSDTCGARKLKKNVGESTPDHTPAHGLGESILPSHLFCSVNQGSRALMHTSQCWHHIPLVPHSFQYCSKTNSSQIYIFPCIRPLGSLAHAPEPPSHLKEEAGIIRVGSSDVISAPWFRWPSICTIWMSCVNLGMSYGLRQASFHLAVSGTAVPGAEPCLCVSRCLLPGQWGWIEN